MAMVGMRVSTAIAVLTIAGPVAPTEESRARPASQEPAAVPRLKAEMVRAELQEPGGGIHA